MYVVIVSSAYVAIEAIRLHPFHACVSDDPVITALLANHQTLSFVFEYKLTWYVVAALVLI